jgi:hypothetical protein
MTPTLLLAKQNDTQREEKLRDREGVDPMSLFQVAGGGGGWSKNKRQQKKFGPLLKFISSSQLGTNQAWNKIIKEGHVFSCRKGTGSIP